MGVVSSVDGLLVVSFHASVMPKVRQGAHLGGRARCDEPGVYWDQFRSLSVWFPQSKFTLPHLFRAEGLAGVTAVDRRQFLSFC